VDRQNRSSSSAAKASPNANANAGVAAEVPLLDADKDVALTVAMSVEDDAYARGPRCERVNTATALNKSEAIYAFPFVSRHFPGV